jgi:hypothetical protein
MVPGLNEADCRVAEFRYRQMVTEGQRQQFAAALRPTPHDTRPLSTMIRQQIGTLLMRTGQRRLGASVVASETIGSAAVIERGAIA